MIWLYCKLHFFLSQQYQKKTIKNFYSVYTILLNFSKTIKRKGRIVHPYMIFYIMVFYSKVFLNQPPKQEKKEENFLNLVLYAFFSTIEIFLFYNKIMKRNKAYENLIKRGKKLSIKETDLFMNEIKYRWGYTFILARNIEASFYANAADRTPPNVFKRINLIK